MRTRAAPGDPLALRYRAGALAVAAGVAHGLVAPEHLREWWGYGLFFAVAAIGQVFYGALLLAAPWRYDDTGGLRPGASRHEPAVYLAGIVATSILILLYVVTRTIGIPLFGPGAGTVEPLTAAGVLTKVLEALLVANLVALRRSARVPGDPGVRPEVGHRLWPGETG